MMNFLDYRKTSHKLKTLLDITPHFCKTHHIEGLVFDFDAVLNTDGELLIHPSYQRHFSSLLEHFPVAIYSNAHLPQRKKAMLEAYPNLTWLEIPPKKPSAQRLEEISNIWSLKPQNILMIDDRILTGGLSAYRAGTQFAHIIKPITCYRKRFFRELFFALLRALEGPLVKLINIK